jgi:hypothetical protein
MIKLLNLWLFATTMTGTVDQISGGSAVVELVAKDGHAHEESLPTWMFPCKIEEGTRFYIKIKKDSVTIKCDK